jgi:hypothetical protein
MKKTTKILIIAISAICVIAFLIAVQVKSHNADEDLNQINKASIDLVTNMLKVNNTPAKEIHSGKTFKKNDVCTTSQGHNGACDYVVYATNLFVYFPDGKEEIITVGKYIYNGDGGSRFAIITAPNNSIVKAVINK